MISSHAGLMLIRHVCLQRKTLRDSLKEKHVKFHFTYLSSYLRQSTRYFNSFIFFLGTLGYCALRKIVKIIPLTRLKKHKLSLKSWQFQLHVLHGCL